MTTSHSCAATPQQPPNLSLPSPSQPSSHAILLDRPDSAEATRCVAKRLFLPAAEPLHDLDANTQWLEALTPCAAQISAPCREVSAAQASEPFLSPSAAQPESSTAAAPYTDAIGATASSQQSSKNMCHNHQPGASKECQLDAPYQPSFPRTQLLTASHDTRIPPVPSEPHSSSSDSENKLAGHQLKASLTGHHAERQTGTMQQQGSSDESDQMTFAEAAGIRRRPDAMTWPALAALQEGRQVRLLDKNSPVPPRSKARSRSLRDSSGEGRRRRQARNVEDSAMDLAGCRASNGKRSRAKYGTGTLSSAATASDRNVPSSDDESSLTLERLLAAWQKGASDSEGDAGISVQPAASSSNALHEPHASAGVDVIHAAAAMPCPPSEPDQTISAPAASSAAQVAMMTGDEPNEALAASTAISADPILGDFWDMWQDAAKQSASSAGQLQAPAACAISIPRPGKHHRSKHASSASRVEHSAASEHLHWRQRHQRRSSYTLDRLQKHPAAAAAAMASSPADDAARDPLEDLLALYPGLDPVVADLILQARTVGFWTSSTCALPALW